MTTAGAHAVTDRRRLEHPDEIAARVTARAGVVVRGLTETAELEAAADLFITVWRPADGQPQLAAELMRAWEHAGCYVAGAYDGDVLLGACAGFFGHPGPAAGNVSLHSHIAGVLPAAQGRAVGHAIKAHQYAWAATHGVAEIVWTYDPLLARNAYFNIAKLGAAPVEYLVDFYGEMDDGLNAGQGSDRLYVRWPVAHRVDTSRRDAAPAGAPVVLSVGPGDAPVVHAADLGDGPVLVAVPADVERMRELRPDLARDWRHAVRDVLGGLLADGGQVVAFTRAGQYVVERGAS